MEGAAGGEGEVPGEVADEMEVAAGEEGNPVEEAGRAEAEKEADAKAVDAPDAAMEVESAVGMPAVGMAAADVTTSPCQHALYLPAAEHAEQPLPIPASASTFAPASFAPAALAPAPAASAPAPAAPASTGTAAACAMYPPMPTAPGPVMVPVPGLVATQPH